MITIYKTVLSGTSAEQIQKRASMLADYAFSFIEYASLFILMIFGGLALMASAAGPAAG